LSEPKQVFVPIREFRFGWSAKGIGWDAGGGSGLSRLAGLDQEPLGASRVSGDKLCGIEERGTLREGRMGGTEANTWTMIQAIRDGLAVIRNKVDGIIRSGGD
jgi:hypothetical protein